MSTASPRLDQEIEDIERQIDACLHRIRDLEDHVRVEIEQQKEEMLKLRSQLRRALAAIAELHLPTTATASEAEAAVPDAYSDSLPEMAAGGAATQDPKETAALLYAEEVPFDDPFASVLPDTPVEIEDDPVSEADSASGHEDPTEWADESFDGSALLVDEPTAETEFAPQGTAYTEDDSAGAPADEAETVLREPDASEPLDAEALSDFIIPTDAFSSNLDDAFEAAPDPFADAAPSAEAFEAEAEEPKSLSEFDRLLDWSDFEPDEVDDGPAGSDTLASPSGDGMTATHVPAAPAVPRERPVAITRKTPATDARPKDARPKQEQDLTVITGIDEDMQTALRRMGVTTLDEIASWHPADAQRVAERLGTVSEREIFDVWVLEAQSALFDLFQQRLRNNRFHNLDEI